ncbi:MAG: hypothetical protein ACFE95_08445 [Candidatus Hodarchaeota archaeon]
MPNTIFEIFTNYEGQIDEIVLGNYLDLSESFVNFSKGERLTKDKIRDIQKKFGGALVGTLFSGGKDTIFAWSIPIGKMDVLLKPYYKQNLLALIFHYLSVETFGNTRTYEIDQDFVTTIIFPPVIGLANIAFDTHSIPVLITKESKGKPILNNPSIVVKLGEVAKRLAYEGFIVDLYPSNWRLHPSNKDYITLEYIDLVISKTIDNVKVKLFNIIRGLGKKDDFCIGFSPEISELVKRKTPLTSIDGIGPVLEKRFRKKLDIHCVEDFISYSEIELAKVYQMSIKKARDFLRKAQDILGLDKL